ncbi:hypothetical protein SCUCBS95973_006457 [Sporothrix curviconia]|uniref:CPAF-like PDZ domain-containing protein n=1 Tax=Sporothrix curviconia TaxID=1260050 RepID=A0ABP0C5K2_9PEZI
MKTVAFLGLPALALASCNADNCLRALRATQTPGRLQSAESFCSVYTAAASASVAIPSYAVEACQSNQVGPLSIRLSSACSCLGPVTTATGYPSSSTSLSSVASSLTSSTSSVLSYDPGTTTSTIPSATPPVTASPTTTEPCALASSAWYAQYNSANFDTITIPAELAYDCLASVPLHKDEAVQLVDSIEPYLEWQTDAAYKADPPADYFYPPYDMFAALAEVRSNLVNDVYDSEYAFQIDLYLKVFGQGHDGHFVMYPDLLSRAFIYSRPYSLVSVSDEANGGGLPVIKVYEDVVADPKTASAVVQINGVDAATYIENTIFTASFNQDPDAAYNSMFYAKAVFGAGEGSGYFSGGGRIRFSYQGPATTLTFANGTNATFTNTATVLAPLTGITDGESMFETFCSGANQFQAAGGSPTVSALPSSTSSAVPTATPSSVGGGITVPGFPAPVDITDDAIVSCYFLDGNGFEDVAVLSVLAFESESPAEFQAVTRNCIAQARAAGKTKLVVDFSANGGGYILQGYDFFRQLFPRTVQDGYSRWKANDAFVAISHVFSDAVVALDPYTSNRATLIGEYETWFDVRYDLDINDKPFHDFPAKFGPYVFQDTNYTAIMRWNLDDTLTTINATFGMGMEITGYGNLSATPSTVQPFAADEIVLLYDGFCASTCTLASEMLRLQGGVKSIAMGGRPRAGPIQGVGGIKGAQTLAFGDVYSYAASAMEQAATVGQRQALARYNELPVLRSSAAALNTRDQILRGNVKDGLPAQYVVEEADCRLYWTAAMATDVTAVWKAAAQAAFNGGACAAGGISPPPSPYKDKKRDTREQRRWAAASESSLAKRRAVAESKAVERRNGGVGAAPAGKDMQRFHAMFNQKAIA